MPRFGKESRSGEWRLVSARCPNARLGVFENLEYGSSPEEISENYGLTREQIQSVVEFAPRIAAAAPPTPASLDPEHTTDTRTL